MVKYCQECGNPSYDGATICGNCGAKFPPKSEKNSKPPVFEEDKKSGKETKSDFNFSKTVSGFKNLSKKLKEETASEDKKESKTGPKIQTIESIGFDLSKKLNLESKDKKEEEEKQLQHTYGGSVIGFKEKDKGIKDPARKFKTVVSSTEKSKAEKEEKVNIKAPKDDAKEQKSLDLPDFKSPSVSFNFTKKNIILIGIVAIILAAIIGASIASMTQPSTEETLYYTDGTISYYYPGNWTMYNETNDSSGEIAFKTPNKVLIGYTSIKGDYITVDLINEQISQTAESLGGSVIKYKEITINGVPATDVTISSADHGFSRYISILRDGVYYSFVINNGKSSNPDSMDSLNTPDIQNMINSIKFTNRVQTDTTATVGE